MSFLKELTTFSPSRISNAFLNIKTAQPIIRVAGVPNGLLNPVSSTVSAAPMRYRVNSGSV